MQLKNPPAMRRFLVILMVCTLPVGAVTADEKKSELYIESDNNEHVWLAGSYPEIATHTNWRCVVTAADGTVTIYDIEGGESDSQAKTTRVKVNLSTV